MLVPKSHESQDGGTPIVQNFDAAILDMARFHEIQDDPENSWKG